MDKTDMFAVSVRCPKCGYAIQMRVSNNPKFAYHCLRCDEDFVAEECTETASDCYEITLTSQTQKWFEKHKNSLKVIADKYEVSHTGYDKWNDGDIFIDFGWCKELTTEQVQKFTDDVVQLISSGRV